MVIFGSTVFLMLWLPVGYSSNDNSHDDLTMTMTMATMVMTTTTTAKMTMMTIKMAKTMAFRTMIPSF